MQDTAAGADWFAEAALLRAPAADATCTWLADTDYVEVRAAGPRTRGAHLGSPRRRVLAVPVVVTLVGSLRQRQMAAPGLPTSAATPAAPDLGGAWIGE